MTITKKELKRLAVTGAASDVSNISNDEMIELIRGGIDRVAFAYGVYGCSGALFRRHADGEMYVVIGRVGNLWHVMA